MIFRRIAFLSMLFCALSLQGFAQEDEEDDDDDEYGETELVDSLETDSLIIGHDHEEHEKENSLEEYLRIIGYYFDTTMVPANSVYNFWDTEKIHPYRQNMDSVADSSVLLLQDGQDCFFHPPANGKITSHFGYRRWGRRYKFHYGTDLALSIGDPVYAVFDGIVRIAQYSTSYGNVVVVRHYNGLETIYAHFSMLLVMPGMSIRAGEPIGLGGNTGRSTGPHLHFEVRYKGVAFDAEKIIDFQALTLKSDTLAMDKTLFSHLKDVKKMKSGKGGKGGKYYKVRSGDNLGSIARKHGTSIKKLQQLNGLGKRTSIRAGQKLRVR